MEFKIKLKETSDTLLCGKIPDMYARCQISKSGKANLFTAYKTFSF